MAKLRNILSGWKNFIEKSEVSELEAERRGEFCVTCPDSKKGILTAMIKDDLKQIEGHYCDLCKCPLSAKLRSKNETCPKGLW